MRRQLPLIHCANCGREFAPIRIDAKYCCRSCLERHFIDERRLALEMYRQMQRGQKFFTHTTTLDGSNEEMLPIRRTG